MRLAIILDEAESRDHYARQCQKPDLLDPDPDQRVLAEAITAGLRHQGRRYDGLERDDDGRSVVDLYDTSRGHVRYLYTLIGEGF